MNSQSQRDDLLTAILSDVRDLTFTAMKALHIAWVGIRTYRSLVMFYVKRFLKTKCARIGAGMVIIAMVAELVAPFTHFPYFHLGPRSQVILGISLFLLGSIGCWAHSVQGRANHQYRMLVRSLHGLSSMTVDLAEDPKSNHLATRLELILASFNPIFGHPRDSIYSGILLPDVKGNLVRFCHTPSSDYNRNGVLPAKQGAGGHAASSGKTIYVPNVAYSHGIRVVEEGEPPTRSLRLERDAFQQFGASAPPFRSLLCVPMEIGGQGGCGVFYVGSRRTDAFNNDFFLDAAQLEAKMLAAALSKHFGDRRTSGNEFSKRRQIVQHEQYS